jgi:hypothetical protein
MPRVLVLFQTFELKGVYGILIAKTHHIPCDINVAEFSQVLQFKI